MRDQNSSGIPRGKMILGIAAWLVFIALYTALLPQIVAAGGYGLANLLLGAGMVAMSYLLIRSVRQIYPRTELAENPEPLMRPWEYELPARTTLANDAPVPRGAPYHWPGELTGEGAVYGTATHT
jgi:hypothetical protein